MAIYKFYKGRDSLIETSDWDKCDFFATNDFEDINKAIDEEGQDELCFFYIDSPDFAKDKSIFNIYAFEDEEGTWCIIDENCSYYSEIIKIIEEKKSKNVGGIKKINKAEAEARPEAEAETYKFFISSESGNFETKAFSAKNILEVFTYAKNLLESEPFRDLIDTPDEIVFKRVKRVKRN